MNSTIFFFIQSCIVFVNILSVVFYYYLFTNEIIRLQTKIYESMEDLYYETIQRARGWINKKIQRIIVQKYKSQKKGDDDDDELKDLKVEIHDDKIAMEIELQDLKIEVEDDKIEWETKFQELVIEIQENKIALRDLQKEIYDVNFKTYLNLTSDDLSGILNKSSLVNFNCQEECSELK